ncbi:Cystathionine beta-lyase PatB [Actinomyces bovis]|uniref:cysteine-S-conjugate beta-lyase n=1 Tax=Actinomyces bovis TaxID=1658 RepID=A0ABY1VQC9_9ACTO|nr:aminotransferase class I/II-fold pyridoxal phosphate-dependent enzyme [Actinomyces bovis]SPT53882.1 Cystathionine beta-lyase PatB [Actinomyces bovis]VEG53310.1 Cystathionine beta-lyase PatB [Actinomyces israelii]
MDAASTISSFDSVTPEVLRERASLKWARDPQAIGAWVAESDLGTAPAITAVLEQAVQDGAFGYLPPALSAAVAQATANFQARRFGWQVDAADVSLLPDVLCAFAALLDRHSRPGSAVIVPTPAYMPFLTIPSMYGRKCVQVPSRQEPGPDGSSAWSLDLDGIAAAMRDGAGVLVLCNPWNPVGRVLSTVELDAVADLACRYGVTVFADEIHGPLVLDPRLQHVPYASRPGADPALTFTATAASKGWNVAGLKCAQLIASGGARAKWESSAISRHLAFEASILGAKAAVAALSPDGVAWLDVLRGYLWGNAQVLTHELSEVPGLTLSCPEGTYLAWLDLTGTRAASDPAGHLLREAQLVVNEGEACGRGYESCCRLNLATSRSILTEMAGRISQAVA